MLYYNSIWGPLDVRAPQQDKHSVAYTLRDDITPDTAACRSILNECENGTIVCENANSSYNDIIVIFFTPAALTSMANITPRSISITCDDGRRVLHKPGPLTVTTTDMDNTAVLYFNPVMNGELAATVTRTIYLDAHRAITTHRGLLGSFSVRVTMAASKVELHVRDEAALAHWASVLTPNQADGDGLLPVWLSLLYSRARCRRR